MSDLYFMPDVINFLKGQVEDHACSKYLKGQMKKSGIYIFIIMLFWGCASEDKQLEVIISNPADFDRNMETVVIPVQKLHALLTDELSLDDILVKDAEKNILVRQLIDTNQDGTVDELLFQTQLDANSKKNFYLEALKDGRNKQIKSELTTYSRIVPERTDDYTWENDRVAFRTYGMEAQRLVEESKPGGTLSSGIDLWLKRVEYSIIDDWYEKNLDSAGYYHKDHGEGYDPYHVGKSRGTGGVGVWKEETLHTSKNFIAFRTIATGPIRTVFELDYEPWSEFQIKETKRISLDLGSNFSKFVVSFQAQETPPNYTIGITLHEGGGQTELNQKQGWFRHWEAIDDSYVGEGIIADPKNILRSFLHESEVRDQSQLLIEMKPQPEISYYAGFGWQKSGQVKDVKDWDEQLSLQARSVQNPLQVEYK